jgi:hypothetical protein
MTAVKDRVRSHRENLRASGLRPVTIWVPDTRALSFAREAGRQSRLAAQAELLDDTQQFIDAITADVWAEA